MKAQNPGRFHKDVQEPDILARSGLRVCGLVLVRAPRLSRWGHAGQWSNPSSIFQVIIGISSWPSSSPQTLRSSPIAFIMIPIRQLHLGIVSGLGVAVLTSVFTPVSGGQVIILEVLLIDINPCVWGSSNYFRSALQIYQFLFKVPPYMQKAGDTCDISPQFFLDFP